MLAVLLRGHHAYCSIAGNIRALQIVHHAMERYWRKMLSGGSLRRIVLGSDAWGIIQVALADGLAAVESQRELAASVDIPNAV